jgi:hypothetical protein
MAQSNDETAPPPPPWSRIRWVAVVILGVLLISYLLAVPLGAVDEDARLSSQEVLLAAAFIVGLAAAERLGEVHFGSFVLKLRDVEARQAKLETEVNEFQDRVISLFLNTMAETMYGNLVGLEKRQRPYGPEHRADLVREIELLRDLGYVGNFDRDGLGERGNLADHVAITPRGSEFIALRDSLTRNEAKWRRYGR